MVRRSLDLACLIVFGSRARGDWRPWSDVDVVVILRGDLTVDFEELSRILHEPLVDYRVYTASEAFQAIGEGDPTILLALYKGVAVYGDGLCGELRELFKELWRVDILSPKHCL